MECFSYINIHTHQKVSDSEVLSVLNIHLGSLGKREESDSAYFSVGIHPWHINEETQNELLLLEKVAAEKQLIAIGECGLDKLAETNFAIQQDVFVRQIAIAQKVQKALIIHCVKAWNETLEILADINPKIPVVFHGFRGKPTLARELTKRGYYLSFGQKMNEESLKNTPLDHLFLETDEANFPIQDLYRTVAEMKNVSEEQLKEKIYANFLKIKR